MSSVPISLGSRDAVNTSSVAKGGLLFALNPSIAASPLRPMYAFFLAMHWNEESTRSSSGFACMWDKKRFPTRDPSRCFGAPRTKSNHTQRVRLSTCQ
jgi:hypothetical protein